MKKFILLSLVLMFSLSINSQELSISKPIEVFYKSGDQIIETLSDGEGVVFMFQDDRFEQITSLEQVIFKDKEAMQYFFSKVSEVQSAPKTENSVDVSVVMDDFVMNDKSVKIIRYGNKQFVTYIYVGEAYSIIPKTYLKKLLKDINS